MLLLSQYSSIGLRERLHVAWHSYYVFPEFCDALDYLVLAYVRYLMVLNEVCGQRGSLWAAKSVRSWCWIWLSIAIEYRSGNRRESTREESAVQ